MYKFLKINFAFQHTVHKYSTHTSGHAAPACRLWYMWVQVGLKKPAEVKSKQTSWIFVLVGVCVSTEPDATNVLYQQLQQHNVM